ncbi:MAG: YidC/Oxa1 family membrane protein insertase [Alpinimonas sp.]|jgi:YidC/Oxa1 family membrane protein insertase
MPTPGSQAAKAREERLSRKGKGEITDGSSDVSEIDPKPTQRQQPLGKNRSKKKPGKKSPQ